MDQALWFSSRNDLLFDRERSINPQQSIKYCTRFIFEKKPCQIGAQNFTIEEFFFIPRATSGTSRIYTNACVYEYSKGQSRILYCEVIPSGSRLLSLYPEVQDSVRLSYFPITSYNITRPRSPTITHPGPIYSRITFSYSSPQTNQNPITWDFISYSPRMEKY